MDKGKEAKNWLKLEGVLPLKTVVFVFFASIFDNLVAIALKFYDKFIKIKRLVNNNATSASGQLYAETRADLTAKRCPAADIAKNKNDNKNYQSSKVEEKDNLIENNNYFNPYIANSASDGDKTLTFDCFLSSLSPESIGQLSFNAKAKYGESLKFNSIASGSLSKNSDAGIMFISFLMNEKTIANSSFVNLVCNNNLSIRLPSSENKNSGVINSKTLKILLDSNTSNVVPILIKAENTAFTSTTNNIDYLPFNNPWYLLANDRFTSSANPLACSSVNLDLDTILLSLANSSNSSFSLFSIASCQLIPDADSNSFSSSGISTFNSAILISPTECSKCDYLKLSSNLQNKTEVDKR